MKPSVAIVNTCNKPQADTYASRTASKRLATKAHEGKKNQ